MTKARILQALAGLLILLGLYIIYESRSEENTISLLSGISPIMMGVALVVISKNKMMQSKSDDPSE